jgi:AAT family amino acid transporter/D-serine/D-alanine/glycine transporter
LIALLALYGTNLLAVKVFGELEFWFALIKVLTIVALILSGLAVIFFGLGVLGHSASFSNLWTHGAHGPAKSVLDGVMPNGFRNVLLALQMVIFAYQGVELIGVTAGEAADPQKSLPKATNGIVYRILIFYLGALAIIMALVPWDQLSPNDSPFVSVFTMMGIPVAAGIINLVVITAASSSCNSGIFSTGRMLHSLALKGQAPRIFAKLNPHQVPAAGIHVSAALMLIGVILNYVFPASKVFAWVTSVSTIGTLWTWGIIMIAHYNYRRAVEAGRLQASPFRMPGAPVINWLVVAFLLCVTGLLSLDPENRVALFVAPVWFTLLLIGYAWSKPRGAPAAEPTPSK